MDITNNRFLLAEYKHLGYNCRMTDIQGAIGKIQMDRADWIVTQRRLADAYREAI